MRHGAILYAGIVVALVSAQADGAEPAQVQTPSAQVAPANLRAAIAKERGRLWAPVRADLRPKVIAASHTLLQELAAHQVRDRVSKDPNAKPADPAALARRIVVDARYLDLATRSETDVDALTYLVLLQAGQDAEQEADASRRRLAAINAVASCKKDRACIAALKPTASMTLADINSVVDQAKDNLDSMSEMGEVESLRLQMAMDRMSKLMSTLSNILKKISDTAQSIVQNMK